MTYERVRAWAVAAMLSMVLGVAGTAGAAVERPAGALTASGWTTVATATPSTVSRGGRVSLVVDVTSATARTAIVDVRIFDGSTRRFRKYWGPVAFAAGQKRSFTTSWTVPSAEPLRVHSVRLLRYSKGFAKLLHRNSSAETFTVQAASTSDRFTLRPAGSSLPSDGWCADHVRPAREVRAGNRAFNATRGSNPTLGGPVFGRVTGNFVGTTDEIIQWAACKWGFDEDAVRAEAAIESWWRATELNDWTTDASRCAPNHCPGADGRPGECPKSYNLYGTAYFFFKDAFPSTARSTAYALDYALAVHRNCFEGNETWLNTVERGKTYAKGDYWGCVGRWNAGRWWNSTAVNYVNRVKGYLSQRIWTTQSFLDHG